ncbi:MAG: ATP synthase F1 subunit gamma [Bacteroidota bacterium]
MPGLKEVRIRIASVSSTKQITSAMKMVSASKLRKAQTAIVKLRPYANKLRELLQNLGSSIESADEGAYFKARKVQNVLVITVSSNRGLCGAFNANVIKAAVHHIEENYATQFANGNVSLLCIGKKTSEFFSKRNYIIAGSHHELFDALTYDNTTVVAERLMKEFVTGKWDRIDIVYNQFKNAAMQNLTVEQFLPVPPITAGSSMQADYTFEPGRAEIVGDLVPKSLKVQFYKAVLDSYASEHGARMTTMHKATDNAEELLKNLRITYNKARQATITNEIIEIVGGANALKG